MTEPNDVARRLYDMRTDDIVPEEFEMNIKGFDRPFEFDYSDYPYLRVALICKYMGQSEHED